MHIVPLEKIKERAKVLFCFRSISGNSVLRPGDDQASFPVYLSFLIAGGGEKGVFGQLQRQLRVNSCARTGEVELDMEIGAYFLSPVAVYLAA